MTDFRIITRDTHSESSPLGFALGKHTGSLYLVKKRPKSFRMGVGIAIIGKHGIRVGSEQPLDLDEVLPIGTVIEITI